MIYNEQDREDEFQRYMELKTEYFEEVEANGDVPWFKDPEKLAKLGISGDTEEDRRRQLFMRRYRRPQPPQTIPARSVSEIRDDHRHWTPAEPIGEVAA